MLRITREEGRRSQVVLRLEGSIAAEWAALLEGECLGFFRFRRSVSLDLAGVSFLDRAGIEVLSRLSRAGAEIVCRSGPVASVLEGEGIRVRRDADGVDDRSS